MADYERHICGKGSSCESSMATSISYSNYNSNTRVPYSAEQFVNYVYVGYPSTKKHRGFRLKKIYSTRARGRSSPLQSLARKICRFKVRTILLGDPTGTEQTQQTR
ncbi:hypothetical protein L6164_033811 [Bauhinia variegata]|uniref:Uncharacterized protein n=1 Tax=Bauhinia variegata TaxID=167791 RepID=A0ACB9KTJ3_BAUVA|nr:hypothetical protein L6164_033811 [Bauhinia variegata]